MFDDDVKCESIAGVRTLCSHPISIFPSPSDLVEHIGIFRNPANLLDDRYKSLSMFLHVYAGAVWASGAPPQEPKKAWIFAAPALPMTRIFFQSLTRGEVVSEQAEIGARHVGRSYGSSLVEDGGGAHGDPRWMTMTERGTVGEHYDPGVWETEGNKMRGRRRAVLVNVNALLAAALRAVGGRTSGVEGGEGGK